MRDIVNTVHSPPTCIAFCVIARETSNVTYLEKRLRSNLIYVIYIASEILRKVLRRKKEKYRNF